VTGRIRIPGIVDILRTDDPSVIRVLTEDPRLGRDFSAKGPLLNRLIAGRVRRAFHVAGIPFAAVAPRDYPGRADHQLELERKLADAASLGIPTPGQLATLASYVRADLSEAELGRATQEMIGRLFEPGYKATPDTWEAACLLDAAPRTFNPLTRLRWALGGQIGRARGILQRGVGDNPAAMHATAVAVHTLVRSLREMRSLWRTEVHSRKAPAEVAVTRCLHAPQQVLRSWAKAGTSTVGDVRPGSLAILQLDKARVRSPDAQMTFMVGNWAQCPANAWTTKLLAAVWTADPLAHEPMRTDEGGTP
jgi:hypothetical protein